MYNNLNVIFFLILLVKTITVNSITVQRILLLFSVQLIIKIKHLVCAHCFHQISLFISLISKSEDISEQHLCNTRQDKAITDYNDLTALLMAAGLKDKWMTVAGLKAEQLENILKIAVTRGHTYLHQHLPLLLRCEVYHGCSACLSSVGWWLMHFDALY